MWFGRAFNVDEAYEVFEGLGFLAASRADKERAPPVHASTLNTLIASGKTRRATRTSTNFGEARGKSVSISLVGNAHPSKFIPIDRGDVGIHTACSKERFLICVDRAAARHAALPARTVLPSGSSPWSWLPLTPQQAAAFGWEAYLDAPGAAQQAGLPADSSADEPGFAGPASGYRLDFPDGNESRLRYRLIDGVEGGAARVRTEFRISARWNLPDPTEHIRAVARRLARHFLDKPHQVLPFEPEARNIMLGNQVAQSVRAELAAADPALAALEANAAWQQGVQAGLLAALDYAAGGGKLDPDTNLPLITVEHVQCARRLVDISVDIRKAWRAPVHQRAADETSGDEQPHLARAVAGHYPASGFSEPLATQPWPAPLLAAAAAAAGPLPVAVGEAGAGADAAIAEDAPAPPGSAPVAATAASSDDIWRDVRGSQPDVTLAAHGEVPADLEPVSPVQFRDLPPPADFDDVGLGEGGAMIFSKTGGHQLFKDREFIRRFLLSGKSHSSIAQLVDNYVAPGLVTPSGDTNTVPCIHPLRRPPG